MLVAATTGAVACGGDDDDNAGSSGKGGKAGRAGSSGKGVAGDDGVGGDTSTGGQPGGNGGTSEGGAAGNAGTDPTGGVPIGGASGMGGAANNCTSPPPLPSCASATGCVACLCTSCSEAWTKCLADPGCTKAAGCIAAGCSESLCTSLTSGDESLALALAVDDCRSGKTLCRSSCSGTGTSTGGAAGSGTTVTAPTCCAVNTEATGCSGIPEAQQTSDEKAVQACLCAKDAFCCDKSWDACCQAEISELGCGPECPGADITTCNPPDEMGGAGGVSGSGGSSGSGGTTGGSGGSASCGTCDFDEVCDTKTQECVKCITSGDCSFSVYGPVCLGTADTGRVCGCQTNTDCKNKGSGPVCDAISQYCGCLTDNDCTTSFFGKRCQSTKDPSLGTIKQCGCSTDADCPATSPSCHFSVCGQVE